MYKTLDKVTKLTKTKKGVLLIILLIYILFVVISCTTYLKHTYGPSHFEDEVLYWNAAKSLAEGQFSVAKFHHYPPLYSLSLLPVFNLFSPSHVFEAAKILNSIYISSVIFPIYLLARLFLDRKQSLLVSVLIMLLPTQMVISRSMISENIFYPLFFWTLLLAFKEITPSNNRLLDVQNVLLGILSGVLVLTRYIGLAIVPGIWMIWWLRPSSITKSPIIFARKKLVQAASIFIPFAIIVGIWVLLGLREGVALKNMLGFGISGSPSKLGSSGLLNWIIFYLSYTILIAAPHLGILFASFSRIIPKNWDSTISRWLISVIIICMVFLIAVIRHSYRAPYNFPDPVKIQGRYIIYFTPIFIITAFSIIRNLNLAKISRNSRYVVTILSSFLIIAAYLILIQGKLILDEPLQPSINSPDGYLLQVLNSFYPIISIFLIFIAFLIPKKSTRFLNNIYPLVIAFIYIIGSVFIFQNLLLPRQLNNFQAYSLIKKLESSTVDQSNLQEMNIQLSIPLKSTYSNQSKWEYTFRFRGYDNLTIIKDENLGGSNSKLLELSCFDSSFSLINLEENQFNPNDPSHFMLQDNYFKIIN